MKIKIFRHRTSNRLILINFLNNKYSQLPTNSAISTQKATVDIKTAAYMLTNISKNPPKLKTRRISRLTSNWKKNLICLIKKSVKSNDSPQL